MRRWAGFVAGLAAVALAGPAVLLARASAAGPFRDGFGLHVVAEQRLDPRLVTLTVTTPALPGPAHVRILLPSGFDPGGHRRYPVLYLLHGTSGGAADWTTMGDAEQTTAGLPLIVVMPDIALDGGGGGWCTDWFNGGAGGQPEWETFHIGELVPWVDANLPTVAARGGRAVAGLSQGGFCSMSYAARHPDLFSVALAYSGAPDIAYDRDAEVASTVIINGTEVGLDRTAPNSMFGDRVTEEINWADHDPATLAANLRDTTLSLFTGDGRPGPLDGGRVNPEAMGIEAMVGRDNVEFHDRLDALGIPSTYDDYGSGTHSWPYWARDLRESIGPLMQDVAHPAPDPAVVTYTTADPAYAVYGWHVAMHRPALEFSTLEHAGPSGFALAGSGAATVVTPPCYHPGRVYTVSLRGPAADTTVRLRADPGGRLQIVVPLRPGNPYQEDSPLGLAAGTRVFTTAVAIGT